MKRKLLIGVTAIALLLSAYTGYAFFSTRGLQIYLMGTKMGAIFAGSWQYTLLAAIALWVPGIVVLVRNVSKLRRKKTTAAVGGPTEELPSGEVAGGTGLIEPKKGTVRQTEPLVPVGSSMHTTPLVDTKGTDKITELLAPKEGRETELLDPGGEGGNVTELLETPKGSDPIPHPSPQAQGVTEILMPEPDKAAGHGEKKESGLSRPQFCPNCGNLVTGKKFCSRCGTKIYKEV